MRNWKAISPRPGSKLFQKPECLHFMVLTKRWLHYFLWHRKRDHLEVFDISIKKEKKLKGKLMKTLVHSMRKAKSEAKNAASFFPDSNWAVENCLQTFSADQRTTNLQMATFETWFCTASAEQHKADISDGFSLSLVFSQTVNSAMFLSFLMQTQHIALNSTKHVKFWQAFFNSSSTFFEYHLVALLLLQKYHNYVVLYSTDCKKIKFNTHSFRSSISILCMVLPSTCWSFDIW